MTYVHFVQADGAPHREPLSLAIKGRRRLSAVLREHHLDTGRQEPIVVSVTRAARLIPLKLDAFVDAISRPDAERQVLRKEWSKTVVGKDDVITIMSLPLGGGGGGGGSSGRKNGVSIFASIAAIVLAVFAPFAVPALAGLAGVSTTVAGVAYAGVIIGLNYLASVASRPKANKPTDERPIYGVSGGGNLPRPGDRIPVIYGRCWTTPSLSQPDYSIYEGEDQVLFKRMTIGCGEYTLKTVRIGTQEVWRDGVVVNGLGSAVQVEIITPGAFSSLVPLSVTASPDVQGIELPRRGTTPEWSGPFRVSPPGVAITQIQLNYSAPNGVFISGPKGGKHAGSTYATSMSPYFQYAPADGNGNPIGPWTDSYRNEDLNTQRTQRRTVFLDVPTGEYVVRARNDVVEFDTNVYNYSNQVVWDSLIGHREAQTLRPGITEIGMRIKAGPGLAITQFSQIEVEVVRKMHTRRGSSTVFQESRKALDAFVDIATNPDYGAGVPVNMIDWLKVDAYLAGLEQFDTFDGQINGPVSVWEAWSTVLGPMRSEPVQRGSVLSFQRDEPQSVRRHHFTRRQIVAGTSATELSLDRSQGTASVRSEYFVGGDPKRRSEAFAEYGPTPLASSLVNFEGVTDFGHALHLARWTAASNFYRRETRTFRVELQHRSIAPGDMVGVDTWWLSNGIAAGIESRSGFVCAVDSDLMWPEGVTPPVQPFAYIIDRYGREFGPMRATLDAVERTVTLNSQDVAASEAAAGISFANAIQPDDGGVTTHMRIGTLSEMTENWIVRSIRPVNSLLADIEVVNDSPEVWDAIGEEWTAPNTNGLTDFEPAIPIVAWVRGSVVQSGSALVLRFGCAQALGAVSYQFEISRDSGASWTQISSSPSTSGEIPIDHREGVTNQIRARGIGRAGAAGPWISSSFSTSPAVVFGDDLLTGDGQTTIGQMIQGVIDDVEQIAEIGDDLLDKAAQLTADQLLELEEIQERLAEAQSTEAGTAFLARELNKTENVNGFSALETERRLRTEADLLEAEQRTALAIRLTNAEGATLANAAAFQTLSTRVTQTEFGVASQAQQTVALNSRINGIDGALLSQGTAISQLNTQASQQGSTITSLSNQITSLQSTINAQGGQIAGQSTAVSQLQTTVVQQNNTITAVSQNVTALQAQVAGVGSISLTQLQQAFASSNGTLDALWGLAVSFDGNAAGGIALRGIRRPGSPDIVQFGIYGNAVVSGTLTAREIAFSTLRRGNVVQDEITSLAVQSIGTQSYFGTSDPSARFVFLMPFAAQEACDVIVQYNAGFIHIAGGITCRITMALNNNPIYLNAFLDTSNSRTFIGVGRAWAGINNITVLVEPLNIPNVNTGMFINFQTAVVILRYR